MKRNSYSSALRKTGAFLLYPLSALLMVVLMFGITINSVAQTTNTSPYCNATDDCYYEELDDFTFGNFSNNNSGCNNRGNTTYFDNLGPIQAKLGQTYTVTADVESDNYVTVWIDYDQSNTFEADEAVIQAGSGSLNETVTIPSTQCITGVTRLRIMASEGTQIDPADACDVPGNDDGEVEDYDIQIRSGASSPNDVGITEVITPAKGAGPYNLESLKARVENFSKQAIPSGTTIPITFQTNFAKQPTTINYKLQSTLDTSNCSEIVDLGQVNLACPGVKDLTVWTDYGADVNAANDTLKQTYVDNPFVLGTEDFEAGGQLPADWSNTQNDISIESQTNNGSNAQQGTYYLAFNRSGNYSVDQVTWDVDFTGAKQADFSYWINDCDGSEFYSPSGVLVSFDNGNSYTQIITWSSANTSTSTWVKHEYDLAQLLKAQGLPPLNQVDFLRFSYYDSYEEVGIDNIEIITYPIAKPTPAPSSLGSIGISDTVFYQSFTNIFSPKQGKEGNLWKINGNQIAFNKNPASYVFNEVGKDTVRLEVAGCFGYNVTEKVVEVVKPTKAPIPKFVGDKQIIDPGETVKFTNISEEGPQSWSWTITPQLASGNQAFTYTNGTSNGSYNPEVAFNEPGIYKVCLTVNNAVSAGPVQECKTRYIRVRDYNNICGAQTTTDTIGFVRDGEGSYPGNVTCSYQINPCAEEIHLDLKNLDLKDKQAFLRIYDGKNAVEGEPLWDEQAYSSKGMTGDTLSAAFQSSFTATSGAVFVEFYSKAHDPQDNQGFNLEWNADASSLTDLEAKIAGNTAVCRDKPYTYYAESGFSGADYQWELNGTNISMADSVNLTFKNTQSNTLVLKASHPTCDRQDADTVQLSPAVTSGQPNVNFTANRQIIQRGEVVSLTDVTNACVMKRDWNIQPNSGFRFTNGTSKRSAEPMVQFTSQGVYTVTLEDSTNGSTVGKKTRTDLITVRDYCKPSVVNTVSDIGIGYVELANLMNSSLSGQSDFSNYTLSNEAATVSKGGTYEMTIGRSTAFNDIQYKVWVDLDRNGQFNTPRETLVSMKSFSGMMLQTAITIPAGIPYGRYRMRIGASIPQTNNLPCGPNQYGEFEDYMINVTPDNRAPAIKVHRGDTVNLKPCGSPMAVINKAYAYDAVDGRLDALQVSGGVDSSIAGMYSIGYSVSDDEGNMVNRTQVFNVMADQQPPTFTLNGADTFVLGANKPFNDPGYTNPQDNCSGIQNFDVDAGQLNNNQLGLYPVTYTATDNANNQEVKTRYVKVVDTMAPTFTLKGKREMTINVDAAFTDPGVQNLQDNYWSASEVMYNKSGFVNTKQIGTYTLTYRVEDGSGNERMKTRTVKVRDIAAPNVNSLTGDTITLDVHSTLDIRSHLSISDNHSLVAATDTMGNYYVNFPNGRADVLGSYSLSLNYADERGNETSIALTVKVVDREAPELSLHGPKYYMIPRWDTSAYATRDSLRINDNYYPHFQVGVTLEGSYFTAYRDSNRTKGLYAITYKAEDPSGNKAQTTRKIQVASNPSGVEETGEQQALAVYPNPTSGVLNVELDLGSKQQGSLEITNALGERVELIDQGEISGNTYHLNLSEEASGVYFIRYRSESKVATQRFVITK